MKRVLLLALCVAVLGALAWFLLQSSPAHRSDAPIAAVATTETATKPAALDGELSAPAKTIDDAAASAIAANERTTAPAARAIDPDTAITVRAHFVLDGACSAEDDVEVFAVTHEMSGQDLADDLVRKSNGGKRPEFVLARARVEGDGFELVLPAETHVVHVAVLGRFRYSDKSVPVRIAGDVRTVDAPAMPLQNGTFVRGRVDVPVDVDAKSIDGVRVNVGSSGEGMSGAVDQLRGFDRIAYIENGAFEVRAVPVGMSARATVLPEKLAAAVVPMRDLAACRDTNVKVTLVQGATVRGVVRGEDKQPIAGVEVLAALQGQWFGVDDREVRSTKSDTEGRFELAAVTPGNVRLKAKLEGFLDSEPMKITLANGEQRTVDIVLPVGANVSGIVTYADGKPASGVRVELVFDRSQMFGMSAFNAFRGAQGHDDSDAEGRFEIHGLGAGPFTVTAEALPVGMTIDDPKQRAKSLLRARVDGVKPATKELALVLRTPEGLAGRVIDEAGAPVKKFELTVVRPGQGPMGSFGQEHHDESFESEDGTFLFAGLEPGEWDLYPIAEGFAYPEPMRIKLPRAASDGEFVATIVHAATVRGFVRSPSGEPCGGATVKVDTGGPAWMERVSAAPKRPDAKTEDDGSFTLTGIAAGKIAIRAQAKSFARSLPVALELAPAQTMDKVELVLRLGGTLTGEVYDEQGKPDTGLFVQAHEMSFTDQQITTSDGEGKFRFEHMEPSTWQVVAMPLNRSAESSDSGGSGSSATDDVMALVSKLRQSMVEIQDGVETHLVLGAPPAHPVKIKGRVTHHGDPFTPALVSFYREGKNALAAMKHTQVKADGSFEMTLDQSGYYSISVQRVSASMFQQSLVEFTRDIPEEKEVAVELEMPTARITGHVRGPGGDPAAGVRVSLHPQTALSGGALWGGHYNELVTNDAGDFDVQALRPGTYTLLVGGMSLGGMFGDDAVLGREIKSGLTLSEGEWMRDVDFRLKKPGTLEATVVDDAGNPVTGASVFVRSESGEPVDRFSMVTTDNRGIASYGGLTPGKYTVSARKDLLASAESPGVRIEEGTKQPVALRLGGGTILIITLVGTDDKPVQASLSVQDDAGRELAGMISLSEVMKLFSEGGFTANEKRIGPIPPGRYRVFGKMDDGKTINKNITLTGQPERRVMLRFGE